MRNIYALLPFLLYCYNADADVVKCIDKQNRNYYIASANTGKIQNILNDGGRCIEVIKPLTDAEKREALDRSKLEREIAKENYNRAVRETAKFLDDVDAVRKRK